MSTAVPSIAELPKLDNWVSYSELDKTYYSSLLSGFSFLCSICLHPLNVLTVRQQSDAVSNRNASFIRIALTTYHSIGIRGLFRGCLPLTVMEVPSSLVYYSVYEYSREMMSVEINKTHPTMHGAKQELLIASSCGVLCNVLSLLIYNPAEVVASRMMIAKSSRRNISMAEMIGRVYSEHGLSGFYRGYLPNLLTGTVWTASWWFAYGVYRRFAPERLQRSNVLLFDGLGGLTAGVVAVSLSHPLDTLKTRIMTGVAADKSMWRAAFNAARSRQLLTLWKGFTPALAQASLTSAGVAISYELIKRTSASNVATPLL